VVVTALALDLLSCTFDDGAALDFKPIRAKAGPELDSFRFNWSRRLPDTWRARLPVSSPEGLREIPWSPCPRLPEILRDRLLDAFLDRDSAKLVELLRDKLRCYTWEHSDSNNHCGAQSKAATTASTRKHQGQFVQRMCAWGGEAGW